VSDPRYDDVARAVAERLHPSPFSERWIALSQLRDALAGAASRHLPRDGRLELVDYGCGCMPYRALFAPYVARHRGADFAANPCAELVCGPSGGVPVEAGSVDVVLSTQVLEHVSDPAAYLEECLRMIGPHGMLILSTHGYWMYHPDPVDHWRWTSSGLRLQIERAGFVVTELRGVMGLGASAMQLLQDAVLRKIPGLLRPPLAFLFQVGIAVLDALTSTTSRDADACTFVVVARRREPTP